MIKIKYDFLTAIALKGMYIKICKKKSEAEIWKKNTRENDFNFFLIDSP